MRNPHDDGKVNRDGITQGSGYGDTEAKARDAEAKPTPEEEERITNDKDKAANKLPDSSSESTGFNTNNPNKP